MIGGENGGAEALWDDDDEKTVVFRGKVLEEHEAVAHDLDGVGLEECVVAGVDAGEHGFGPGGWGRGRAESGKDKFGIRIIIVGGAPVMASWERAWGKGETVNSVFDGGGRCKVGRESATGEDLACKLGGKGEWETGG